jgi:hypothetical protein
LVAAAIGANNAHLRSRIKQRLAAIAAQNHVQPFDSRLFPALRERERIRLGTTITGGDYGLEEDDLGQHLLTVGQSGAGKTTLFYNLMEQITVPFWAFDLKQDYRHLVQQDGLDLLVLPWQELRFNPLQPPEGVPPRRWAQVFSEVFCHATALLSGSKNYLMKQLIELYQAYDLLDEVSEPYPSLHELEQLIGSDGINYMRKAANYQDTVLNRLEAMTLTAGTVFDCSQGYPLPELLERDVVFEFDGLATDVQNFLMEILFAAVYEYRLAHHQRGGRLRHVFFLDEGKRVFSVYKERQDAAGIPPVDELTAKMREFGEGLVVADQEASKLTDSIMANTYTKVLLATGDAKQFEAMTGSMTLSDRQQEIAEQLGIGEAVVQAGNRDPMLVRLADYSLDKTVDDEELYQHQQKAWEDLSWTPRQVVPAFEAMVGGDAALESETADAAEEPPGLDLSEDADRLLEMIVEHPFEKLTDRYDRFSSAYKGNKAKKELVENDVVVEKTVATGNGNRKLFDLTEQGREYAETVLEIDTEQAGRGGVVHRYWQHVIRDRFEEAGWTAKLETFDADVYVNMDGVELVIEVAMGNNEREADHVAQHLDTGYDVIWLVCKNEAVRDGLCERLEERDLLDDCVAFRLLREVREGEIDAI